MCKHYFLIIALSIITLIIFNGIFLRRFLCLNKPYNRGILAIESWVSVESIPEIYSIIYSGKYKIIVIAGEASDAKDSQYKLGDKASLLKSKLVAKGIDQNLIYLVQYRNINYNHTYHLAMAIKQWLSKLNNNKCIIDIYTLGSHSRKSYIIFRKIFPPSYKVGIISGEPLSFCTKRWFLSRKGIYAVYKNLLGYFYAKFFPFQLLSSTPEDRTQTLRVSNLIRILNYLVSVYPEIGKLPRDQWLIPRLFGNAPV